MNPIAEHADRVLRAHPGAAMHLVSLLAEVRRAVDPTLCCSGLRRILEESPHRFHVLNAWDARWPERRASTESDRRAWVVATDPPASRPATRNPRLRESIRWVGRTLDRRSGSEMSRWEELVLREEATRQALDRAAA